MGTKKTKSSKKMVEIINTKIKKYIDEVITGKDDNVDKLKQFFIEFFKNKTQQDLDKLDKEQLNLIVSLNNILTTRDAKKSFTEVERALMDKTFHEKKPLKYFWASTEIALDREKIIHFLESLSKLNEFAKAKECLDSIIKEKIEWEDATFDNNDSSLRLEITISNYFSKETPDIEILAIGNKKYEKKVLEAMFLLGPTKVTW